VLRQAPAVFRSCCSKENVRWQAVVYLLLVGAAAEFVAGGVGASRTAICAGSLTAIWALPR
jgi:hypothetical protein